MPTASAVTAIRPAQARCRISNGSGHFLGDVDGRTLQARRHVDLLEDYISDLGGWGHASTGQVEMARRAAAVGAWCDRREAELAAGEEIDFDRYLMACKTHKQIILAAGLDRRHMRDATPALRDYIDGRASTS